jgi:hypothetical protein
MRAGCDILAARRGRGAPRWHDDAVKKRSVRQLRFRHNIAIVILGVVMLTGSVALASSAWYLVPVLLIPLGVIAWGVRGGTDVDADGLRVRALVGSRRLRWSEIDGFAQDRGKVLATLANGRAVALPAVSPADLPRLLKAGGQPSALAEPTEPDDDPDGDVPA